MLRKTMIVLLTAAALTGGLTADALARGGGGGPLDVSAADVHGMGMHGGAHAHHRRGHQAFGLWPWYGYDDAPSYPYDDSYSTPQVVDPEPPRPACQHSEQTVAVPSANGETTQVTILRC
jgi:hypothetical protein